MKTRGEKVGRKRVRCRLRAKRGKWRFRKIRIMKTEKYKKGKKNKGKKEELHLLSIYLSI